MRVANVETFEDVCGLARDIYTYCKSDTPSTDQHQQPQVETPNGKPGDSVESPEGSSSRMKNVKNVLTLVKMIPTMRID